MKKIKYFLDGLTMKQLLLLSQRYDMTPVYKNPQKRRRALFFQIKKYLEKQEIECAICLESIKYDRIIATPCAHLFCDSCLIRHIKNSEKCPICRVSCPYTYVFDHIFYDRIHHLHEVIDTQSIDYETETYQSEQSDQTYQTEQTEQTDQYIEQLFIAIQLQQFEDFERSNNNIITNYYLYLKRLIKCVLKLMIILLLLIETIFVINIVIKTIFTWLNIY